MNVRFVPEAQTEFDDAADWYERKRAGLGVDVVAKVRDVIHRISVTPRMHQIVYRDVRRAVVARFPYIVLYREVGNEIVVVAVFHTSRNPAVWLSRADSP
ncbi:MAG: type II toxin-antitoxin system RelE/ParE family toxin [Gemmataceae bacterium]|nr:type II toxin-antitoxin system RelE/ParE family toxin [Gemmataceae bacterium]